MYYLRNFQYLQLNFGTIFVLVIAGLVSIPILIILGSIFGGSYEIWNHLATTVLGDYIINSLWLIVGVSFGVLIMGVSTAWLVTMCSFPGSKLLEWALLLPLAAPAYLLAYTYTDMMDFFGPIQTLLRAIFGWSSVQDYWFPNVRSLWGAIAMLSLVLYPYVYLLARVAFLEQSVCSLEASRSLGCNPWSSFFTVALPLARPYIIAGLSLALMETLNDYGTVQYFGVNTFTTGIYNTWFGMGNRQGAAQLAAVLLLFIFCLISLEIWSRRQARYYQNSSSYSKYQLNWWQAALALISCLVPLSLGFFMPGGYLLMMSINNSQANDFKSFWQLALNSFILASITAILAVLISLIMAYAQRNQSTLLMQLAVRIASIGYAIPGSVIAVGVLIPFGRLDNLLSNFFKSTLGMTTGLILSGTIGALIFAYLVRFLTVSFGGIESSLNKIKPSLDDAARSLGYSSIPTLVKIHTPLMWSGILTAAMLVFVDVMKELPATLVMRPFNFDTLAIRVYQYASDERLAEASTPALAIILVGIIPVILLSFKINKSNSK